MIDHKHKLSLTRQAKALGISRGSVYYQSRPVSDSDLALMRRIDELQLDYPFAGSRMLKGLLVGEGYKTGRLHVRTLMRRRGTRYTPIYCASCRSSGPIRSGRWT